MAKYDLTQFQLKKAGSIEMDDGHENNLLAFHKKANRWVGKNKPITPTKIIESVNSLMREYDMKKQNYDVEVRVGGDTWFWIHGNKGERTKLLHKD